jgi:hypothetical protein
MQPNTTLTNLDLSWNRIATAHTQRACGCAGLHALTLCLATNSSLERLDLRNTSLDDGCAHAELLAAGVCWQCLPLCCVLCVVCVWPAPFEVYFTVAMFHCNV